MKILEKLLGKGAQTATPADELTALRSKRAEIEGLLASNEINLPALERAAELASINAAIDQGKAAKAALDAAEAAVDASRRERAGLERALELLDAEIAEARERAEKARKQAAHDEKVARAKAGIAALPALERKAEKLIAEVEAFAGDMRQVDARLCGALARALTAAATGEDVEFVVPADVRDELERATKGDFRDADSIRRREAVEREYEASARWREEQRAEAARLRDSEPRVVWDKELREWVKEGKEEAA